MARKKVIVELRVGPLDIVYAVSRLKETGFEQDTDFRPIPISPAKEIVTVRNPASEKLILVRGEIDENNEKDLQSHPGVVNVWTDAMIEPTRSLFYTYDCSGRCIGDLEEVAKFLGVDEIWDSGIRGHGIVLGICDVGVDKYEIPQVVGGWSPWEYLPWGEILAGSDHGNMVATDVLGICPEVEIYDIGVLKASIHTERIISNAIAGFQWAIERYRVDRTPQILTNSWNMPRQSYGPDYASNPNHPFTRKVIEAIQEGIIVVFSAGNCGEKCPEDRCKSDTGPGRSIWGVNGHEEVITVGAVNLEEQQTGYSSQGPAALCDKKPDICGITQFKGYYNGFGVCDAGTSAACAVVTGVVGLLKCAEHQLSQEKIKELLKETARGLDNGFDPQHGIINAKAAFDEAIFSSLKAVSTISD